MAELLPDISYLDILAIGGLMLADMMALLALLGSGLLLLFAGIEMVRGRPVSKADGQGLAWSLGGLIAGTAMTAALFIEGNTAPVGLLLQTDKYMIAILLLLALILLLLRLLLGLFSQLQNPKGRRRGS